MGAEYLAVSQEDQVVRVGHHVELLFAGEIESVRAALVRATAEVGYLVVEDDPIIARFTKARFSSSSIIDYIDTLTIRLKELSPGSSRAIFEYKYADVYGKRAKAVLTRQANAIAALANANLRPETCPSCGTQATDASHFCRKCGSATASIPAEVELMNVVADSHAGYLLALQGTVGFFLSFLTLLLVLAIKGPTALTAALVFTLIFAVPSFVLLIFGLRRMRSAVNHDIVDAPSLRVRPQPTLNDQPARGSFPTQTISSVTEGTTELLKPHRHSELITDDLEQKVLRTEADSGPPATRDGTR